MKCYSLDWSSPACFRNDSTIDFVISCWHKIYAPALLSTIRQIAQLTAFLTYNSSSKSKAFNPEKVSFPSLASPSLVDSNSPSRSVASLRIPTTLQCTNAEASPTHPCAIMLSKSMKMYFSMLNHSLAHWELSEHWYNDPGRDLRLEVSQLTLGECDRKLLYIPQLGHSVLGKGVRDRGVDVWAVLIWCGADRIASVIL